MGVITKFNQPDFVPFGPHQDLIHQILPQNEVCIVAGPSGVGKTTWLFQMLIDWQAGKDVLGYKSYPQPFVYVNNDRSLNSTLKTMWRMDVMCDYIVAGDLQPEPKTVGAIMKIVMTRYPGTKLVVLDTFTGFGPENMNNNHMVMTWLKETRKLCEKYKVTILGAMHTAKQREDNKITDPRQRVLGSVAIGGFSETIWTFEALNPDDTENKEFKLWVMPRQGKEEDFLFTKDEAGKFVMKEKLGLAATTFVLDTFLTPGKEFETKDAIEYNKGIPRRTVERWLADKVSKGEVFKDGRGRYTCLSEVPGSSQSSN